MIFGYQEIRSNVQRTQVIVIIECKGLFVRYNLKLRENNTIAYRQYSTQGNSCACFCFTCLNENDEYLMRELIIP